MLWSRESKVAGTRRVCVLLLLLPMGGRSPASSALVGTHNRSAPLLGAFFAGPGPAMYPEIILIENVLVCYVVVHFMNFVNVVN